MDIGQVLAIVFTGLAIVFIALIVLIVLVASMGKAMNPVKDKKPTPVKNIESSPAKSAVPVIEEGISDEVVAVIAAAIASISESTGTAYAVRGIKRAAKSGRPAWAVAGLNENTRSF